MSVFLQLWVAWTVGNVIRMLIMWVYETTGEVKADYRSFVASVAIGAGVAWALSKIDITTWLVLGVVAIAGYLSQYGMDYINKRRRK